MGDFNPQIVCIEKVEKHPNADALDIVTVLGDYPVVSKRYEYNVGDITCYLPIDTIVPDTEQFYFLCPVLREDYEENGEVKSKIIGPKYPVGSVPEKYRRIKAKKIRGHYSQGMLFPVSKTNTNKLWQIGESIVDVLGLKKYEEEEEDNIPNAKKSRGANAEKAPQGWAIPYYDIDGLRKYVDCLGKDEEIVLTEKVHGCLKHDTKITFKDGTKKPISQVKIGDVLLGVDDSGKIVPSTVIELFNNGTGNNWVKITGTRSGVGRGGNSFSITCTDEHRFFSPTNNSYIRAHELKVGDEVSLLKADSGWLPPGKEFKKSLVTQKITSIEKLEKEALFKYDIETSSHNYFANGVLVHNSNASFCHDGNKLWIKSRNFYKKLDPDDAWCDIAIRYNLEEKLSKFPMMVFFGEMYGQVKGFRYDCEIINKSLHAKIRFFDIWDVKNLRYLDYDPFVAMVKEAGLDLMTELYRGVWKGKEEMYPYAEGMTTLGGKHIREGFVLRTVKERYEPKLDSRMQVKLISEEYNLNK